MSSINYFLYSKKRGKLASIHLRFLHKGSDLTAKSGLFVYPEYWGKKGLNKKILTDEDKKLKEQLSNLRLFLDREAHEAKQCDKDWLDNAIYRFHNQSSGTFLDYLNDYIKDMESGKRKNIKAQNFAKETITNYNAFRDRIKEYQESKRTTLYFKDITGTFYKGFVSFLAEKSYYPNTIGKHIKTLKAVMGVAEWEKLHTSTDYKSFKGISEKSFSVYLTEDELQRLYEAKLNDYHDKIRDAFLVLCETGLRVSDYEKVSVSIKDNLIYIKQKKTRDEVVIPVSSRLKSILDKHKGSLPHLAEQYINREIKNIARECKITEPYHHKKKEEGKITYAISQKCDLITCHTGRRTFCTNAYLAGIPTISIMQISGHTTEANFMKYIKITKEQNARKLADHPFFKLKVV